MPDQQPPAYSHEQVYEALERELASRTEWDQAPAVGQLLTTATGVELRPFPVPRFIWALGQVAAGVDALTGALRMPAHLLPASSGLADALHRQIDPKAFAIYLTTEAWAAPSDVDAEIIRRAQAGGSIPSLASRPDRIEIRTANAVLLDPTATYLATEHARPHPDRFERYDETRGTLAAALTRFAAQVATRTRSSGGQ
ncbi:hypothetical protein [Streptacidiphilus cavernicola]|uniref:DUF5753 domain-containing protein n=1 Tax=Streptacidiphilus cavernicola TaxID=3342716 RepID=A0ABV6VY50_9ACTN